MKLGTLKSQTSLDGDLVVVSKDNKWAVRAEGIAPNLRLALERWEEVSADLQSLYDSINDGTAKGRFEVNESLFHSPLPRTFQWADGSAYIHHIKLVRQSRNAALPETLETVPLMYQGGGDNFLAPRESIPQIDFSHGTDFEAEVAVVTSDVPMGVDPEEALKCVRLVMICNDVSLRGLIPAELKQGFGFFHGKPSSAFSPFAVTPDELGEAWKGGRLHLPMLVDYNNEFFGNADSGAMHFHFGQLIAHAARTRKLMAGTVIGSGTVSNEDIKRGSSCLAEKRMLEKIHEGAIKTPFMKEGDSVKIHMLNEKNENILEDEQE